MAFKNEPDLQKLRRFALAVALIVLTYSVAGIRLEPDCEISVIGMTFKVSRPELLPIGLVIASVFTTLRFYYYGFMLKKSPYRSRRDALDRLYVTPSEVNKKKIPIYFGKSTEFETELYGTLKKVTADIECFQNLFPKFAQAKVSVKGLPERSNSEESTSYIWTLKMVIPIRCKLAAMFQDIDFSSPVWLNLVALGFLVDQYYR
jgi:hypothetical protein